MSTLSLRLPESLHRKLAELAEREGVSLNQLISSAAAEKLAALMTEEYLERRGRRASRKKFDAALAKVPSASPISGDELPADYRKRSRVLAPRSIRCVRRGPRACEVISSGEVIPGARS